MERRTRDAILEDYDKALDQFDLAILAFEEAKGSATPEIRKSKEEEMSKVEKQLEQLLEELEQYDAVMEKVIKQEDISLENETELSKLEAMTKEELMAILKDK